MYLTKKRYFVTLNYLFHVNNNTLVLWKFPYCYHKTRCQSVIWYRITRLLFIYFDALTKILGTLRFEITPNCHIQFCNYFTNHVLTAMIYQVVCRRLMRADDWRFALRRSNGQCAPLFEQTRTSLPNMLPLWYWCICLSQFYLNLSDVLVLMFDPILSRSFRWH